VVKEGLSEQELFGLSPEWREGASDKKSFGADGVPVCCWVILIKRCYQLQWRCGTEFMFERQKGGLS